MIALAKHSLPTSYKVQYHEGLKKQSFNSFQLISSGKQTLKWTNDTLYSREKHVYILYARAKALEGNQFAHALRAGCFTSGGFATHKSGTFFSTWRVIKNTPGLFGNVSLLSSYRNRFVIRYTKLCTLKDKPNFKATISLSQMSKAKLVWALPWREIALLRTMHNEAYGHEIGVISAQTSLYIVHHSTLFIKSSYLCHRLW